MSQQQLNEVAALAANYINTTNRHIFLTGKAGTGKTTFLRYIVQHTYKNTVVAAPTGIAAINAGGVTLHSLLQLPFGPFVPELDERNQTSHLQVNTPLTIKRGLRFRKEKLRLIREMELLIIDEVSMLRADLLDCMDHVLRIIRRRPHHPFGGLQILFIGDLMQLPPVVRETERHLLQAYYKSSYFFEAQALQQAPPLTVELQKIYRQKDQDFIDILNRLRHNQQTADDLQLLNQFYENQLDSRSYHGYIYLTTHNRKADKINHERIEAIDSPTFEYKATIEGDFPENMHPTQEVLSLKKGAQVMFIKNDPSGAGEFFNGKIGTISKLDAQDIWVQCEDEKPILVPLYSWENKHYEHDELSNEVVEKQLGRFEQFPLKLAWAVTIHKSQGLTFEKAILDVSDTFAPGQLYVALSRLTSLKGLKLSSPLPTHPPGIDAALRSFVASYPDIESLTQYLAQDRRGFLAAFAAQAFGFDALIQALKAHIGTFDKAENRSLKQQFLPWTQERFLETEGLQQTGQKFARQVAQLLQHEDLQHLATRAKKAQQYFEPQLVELLKKMQAHQTEVSKLKQVKTYRQELEGLVESTIFQARQIMKCSMLIQETAADRLPTKEMLKAWEQQMTAFKRPPKPIKVPTSLVSLRMLQAGKSVETIASERGLKVGTIMGHLITHVEKGAIDVQDLLEPEVLEVLLPQVSAHEGPLSDLKLKVGEAYSYEQLRLVRAHLRAQAAAEAAKT